MLTTLSVGLASDIWFSLVDRFRYNLRGGCDRFVWVYLGMKGAVGVDIVVGADWEPLRLTLLGLSGCGSSAGLLRRVLDIGCCCRLLLLLLLLSVVRVCLDLLIQAGQQLLSGGPSSVFGQVAARSATCDIDRGGGFGLMAIEVNRCGELLKLAIMVRVLLVAPLKKVN